MNQFLQQCINGLSLGSIYALIALGYTMVYGIIKLINFAHGDIYMLGAYIGYLFATKTELGLIETLLFAMVSCAVIGVVIEKIAYKPLRNAAKITVLITAIGISFFIESVVQKTMGTSALAYPQLIQNSIFQLGEITITSQQILIISTSLVLMVILQFVVYKTKIGKAMRAVSVDKAAASLMGINVNQVISFTFALGSALAAAAGVLVGIYYSSINPLMGLIPGIKAFIAAVFGGIGILPGAVIGGLGIGVIETLVAGYGSSLYKDAIVYLVLIIILLIKPTGLLGKNEKEKV